MGTTLNSRKGWLIAPVLGLALSILAMSGAHASARQPFPFPNPATVDYTQIPIQETGVVDVVADGDTFRFIEDGTSEYVTVRILGVNANEVRGFYNSHRNDDMCGAVEATDALTTLLPPGSRVQLRSLSKESTGRKDRLQRYAFAYNPATGVYDIDVQAALAATGLVMWFTISDEAALSYKYLELIQQAQAAGRGIWNPNLCGPVEQPDASIGLIAHWNAGRNDNANPNGEYVVVRNTGNTAVDLSGWVMRDSSLTSWFTFPDGSVVAPGDFRVVHIGPGIAGTPNARDLYVGSPTAILANTSADRITGDGVYLLDRSTAMRSWFQWPCLINCNDPAQGRLKIVEIETEAPAKNRAKAANQEYIVIKNVGSDEINLDGYYLSYRSSTYPFSVDSRIAPGKKLTVQIGKGSPTRTTQYWGRDAPLLKNSGGTINLLSERNVPISSKSW